MKSKETTQIAIYSRKSKFTGKGESIENQIELCREYIRACYSDIQAQNATIYEDEGFSGGNLERPQFKKMMKAVHQGKFCAIVVYRLDRISRNIADFAKLIDELSSLDVSFISIKEQFDTSSPMGRAMMYIASVFSQLERETIAERIRDNMHELAKTGRWLGGMTPTGYSSESFESVTVDGKKKKACMLQTVPHEAVLVKMIFAKFLETHSLTQTDTYLLQNGYKTKTGKQFTRFSIKGILCNPVYMVADLDAYKYFLKNKVDVYSSYSEFDGTRGVMAYNRTLQKSGKTNQLRPIEEWIVSVGKHEGIVPAEQWISVQKLLEHNRNKGYRKPKSTVALLSGLLKCGGCGGYMRPKVTGRLDADGNPCFSYLCTLKERSHKQCCSMVNLSGQLLDKEVLSCIGNIGEDSGQFIDALANASRQFLNLTDSLENEIERLRNSIEQNKMEIVSLVGALAKASASPAEQYMIGQIELLHSTNQNLQRVLTEKTKTRSQHLNTAQFAVLVRLLSQFEETVAMLSVEQKRTVLRALVREIVWDGDTVHLYLYGCDERYPYKLLTNNGTLGEDSK